LDSKPIPGVRLAPDFGLVRAKGLGIVTNRSRLVPNETFLVAAQTLADQVSESDRAEGRIYPPLSGIRDVSLAIAAAVAQVVYDRGLAGEPKPKDLRSCRKAQMYEPKYRDYRTTCIPGDNRCAECFVSQSEVNQEKSPREMQNGLSTLAQVAQLLGES
jgi:malic enzyme-like protein